jgi:hypothetical protein
MSVPTRARGVGRLVPIALVVVAAGCEQLTGHAVRDWSEDVALDDGRTVLIERHVEFDSSNSLAGDAYSSREAKSRITFRGDLGNLPPWEVPLIALVLYQDAATSEWVVVATTSNCDTWRAWHEPQPKYWAFRLRGSAWVESPVSESSFGRSTNLFIGYEPRLSTSHITIATTKRYIANPAVVETYKSIRADGRSKCARTSRPTSTNN